MNRRFPVIPNDSGEPPLLSADVPQTEKKKINLPAWCSGQEPSDNISEEQQEAYPGTSGKGKATV